MYKKFGLAMALTAVLLAGCESKGPTAINSPSSTAWPVETTPNVSESLDAETPEPMPTESSSAEPSASATPSPQHDAVQAYRIEPVDESSQDPSFAAFREELLTSIEARDLNYIEEHLDPHVKYSFGDAEVGAKGLIEAWDETRWTELKRAVELGGVFIGDSGKMFVAPYLFELFGKLPEQLDAFTYGVAVEKDVKVYADRDETSEVLEILDYTVVQMEYEEGMWTPVTTPSGYEGFVRKGHVRSPVDYRVFFYHDEHSWKIVTFIAGD